MAPETVTPVPSAPGMPIDPLRRTSLLAGVLYLITFVSIPTLALYGPIHDAGYILSDGSGSGVILGGILEVIVALAGVGTAVVLYPVLKRQSQTLALGLVSSRIVEAATIFLGVASLLTIVALRQDGLGPEAGVVGDALVTMYDKAFLLGQGMMPAFNALLLGSLLYQSRLVPRALPVIGLIGAPLLLFSNIGIFFGLWERISALPAITVLPIAVWELSLGVYLTFKGFRQSAVADLPA